MRIVFAKQFTKRFKKLPKHFHRTFEERLFLFEQNRKRHVLHDHALSGEWAGHRSINIIGNYRAIYKEVEVDVFKFVTIGTHSELYGS